jgi:hypothetical protein
MSFECSEVYIWDMGAIMVVGVEQSLRLKFAQVETWNLVLRFLLTLWSDMEWLLFVCEFPGLPLV